MKRKHGLVLREGRRAARIEGFTLVELLVVIVIIAILAGILLPVIADAINTARVHACSRHLDQLWAMEINYMSQYGGTSKMLPAETGGAFWMKLTQTAPPLLADEHLGLLDCPVSGDAPRPGQVQFRGPSENVNLRRTGPIGADLPGAHGQGRGGNIVLRDGAVLGCLESDALWIKAATLTRP